MSRRLQTIIANACNEAVSAYASELDEFDTATFSGVSMLVTSGWVSEPIGTRTWHAADGRTGTKVEIEQAVIDAAGNPQPIRTVCYSNSTRAILEEYAQGDLLTMVVPVRARSSKDGAFTNLDPTIPANSPAVQVLPRLGIPQPISPVQLAEQEAEEAKRRAAVAELDAHKMKEKHDSLLQRMAALEAKLEDAQPTPEPAKKTRKKVARKPRTKLQKQCDRAEEIADRKHAELFPE